MAGREPLGAGVITDVLFLPGGRLVANAVGGLDGILVFDLPVTADEG